MKEMPIIIDDWKEFRMGDICVLEKGKKEQVPTGASVSYKNMQPGDTPRITVTNTNNGIVGKYSSSDKNYRLFDNFISVSFLGTVFYHPYQASLDMKVHCIKFRNIELNTNTGLFIVTALKKAISRFTYSDQLSSTVLPNLIITLPATHNDKPDWLYMEKYIIERKKRVSEYLDIMNDFILS